MANRTTKAVRQLKATLRAHLQQGKTEDECLAEMNVRRDHLRWLRSQLIADELQEVVNDSPEEIWAKYRLLQQGCIKDLDEIIGEAKNGKVPVNTAIGAVKAKAAILENILEKGQDLGIIYKAAEQKQVTAAIAVAQVSVEDLKELAIGKRKALALAKTKFLEADFTEVVETEPIYQEDAKQTEPDAPVPPKRTKVLES